MLHAPTSEAKTETTQSKSQFLPMPKRELHPHAFGAAGAYALNGAGSAASVRSPQALQHQRLTGMQSTYGNQAVLRMMRSSPQVACMPALRPSQGMLLQRKCACGGSSESVGECAECKAKREAILQRHVANQGASPAANAAPPIVYDVLHSPGQPLDAGTRAFMEPRFGQDFGPVRIHTDARAAESARAVNALAYTVGKNVVFGAGQYKPGTIEGRRLMAHELTHVVQQGGNSRLSMARLTIGAPADPFELAAETTAERVVLGSSASAALATLHQRSSEATLRRQCQPNHDTSYGPTSANCAGYMGPLASSFLTWTYRHNATCACENTPDDPQNNCVRKCLQGKLFSFLSDLSKAGAAIGTCLDPIGILDPACPEPYCAAIYDHHVDCYHECCCSQPFIDYTEFWTMCEAPFPCFFVGTMIDWFNACVQGS